MIVTAAGRKMVAMSRLNRSVRPGKRNRAKPYATSVQDSKVPIVEMTAMAMVLKSSRG